MRLKKLEILGFKSFAEKTTINFDVDIIALVGPNGCGKSNIVDAFLWGLGEQSARSLRAEKMQDVLFAGTDNVKSFNLAEVSLTFTDTNSAIGDEIIITRRAYRDGQTQYLINKKEVRLKDVQDLFLGTGIGKNGLFVFEQGRIDEIINMTPEKRRVIFEETAGISRFLQKKKESLTKLAEVDQNYYRLKDLYGEVEKRFLSLQKQAEAAKSYKENKDLLDELENQILAFKFKEITQEITSLAEKKDRIEKECFKAEGLVTKFEKEQVELKKIEVEAKREKEVLWQKHFESKTAIKLIDVELKAMEETFSHLIEREKRALKQKENLSTQKKGKDQEEEKKKQACSVIENEKQEVENEKLAKEAELAELEKKLATYFREEKNAQLSFLEGVQKESQFTTKVEQLELKVETLSVSDKALFAKLKEREDHLKDCESKINKKREELSSLLMILEEEKQALNTHEKQGEEIHFSLQKKEQEKNRISNELALTISKENALLQLQDEATFFSNGAAELLTLAKEKKSEIFGKVEELYKHLQIEEGDYLSFYEEILLVKTRADLETIINFATQKKLGDFSLLLFENLPRFKESVLTKPQSLKSALHMHQKGHFSEIFTDSGIHINQHGVIFYRGKEKSLFSRVNEIKKLKKVKQDLEKQKNRADDDYNDQSHIKKQWELLRVQLQEKRQKKEMTVLQENFYLQRLNEDQKDISLQIEKLKKEKKDQLHSLENFKKEQKEALKELVEAKKKKEAIQKDLLVAERKIQELKEVLSKKMSELTLIRKKYEESTFHLQKALETLKIFTIRCEEEKKEEKRILAELFEIEKLKHEQQEKKKKLLDDKEKGSKQTLQLETELAHVETLRKKETDETTKNDAKLAAMKKEVNDSTKERHKIELKLTEKKGILNSLLEKSQTHLENVTIRKDFLLEDAEKKVYDLRLALKSEQVISLSAIEECKEEEKRFVDLDKQLKDIELAKADLEKIIAKLEKESRRLLKATLEQVRVAFQKNFKLLFNGGDADLNFTNDDNVLEAGVEILGCPPAKKMRILSLLSGGEKCLTTLALLFALFEVRPAPFCILDEVDAPLDEANVGRFTMLLKEFISKTQFIIVTHNKKTMAIADTLLGVSMEKKGISKLITLSLNQNHLTKASL